MTLKQAEARARAAMKKLKKKPGANVLAAICENPNTKKPYSRQAVEHWEMLPLCHIAAVAEYTGLTLAQLRPDVDYLAQKFGPPSSPPQKDCKDE